VGNTSNYNGHVPVVLECLGAREGSGVVWSAWRRFVLISFGSLRPRLKGAAEGILPCQAEEERHTGARRSPLGWPRLASARAVERAARRISQTGAGRNISGENKASTRGGFPLRSGELPRWFSARAGRINGGQRRRRFDPSLRGKPD
jgi:hypothetical protein